MEQLTSTEIYRIYLEATNNDHRYLRPRRWAEVARVISRHKLNTVLEFGAGVSSLLFDNLNLKVDSYETDADFMDLVSGMCSNNVTFHYWDNKNTPSLKNYDLALVDGALPRNLQLELAIKHADFVAVDDCTGHVKERVLARMSEFERLDNNQTFMTIFKTI